MHLGNLYTHKRYLKVSAFEMCKIINIGFITNKIWENVDRPVKALGSLINQFKKIS